MFALIVVITFAIEIRQRVSGTGANMDKKKIILETLTPLILDADQKEKLNYVGYEKVLDDVMASKVFCNIARTGPYGAGKSAIMNTYEQEHMEHLKTIHISLAKFRGDNMENVQVKLMNQIIHQLHPKLIPQTCFQKKRLLAREKWLDLR